LCLFPGAVFFCLLLVVVCGSGMSVPHCVVAFVFLFLWVGCLLSCS
jgi:hypothetical protein